MATASQRIADGHYDERVQVSGSDELGQFAVRFNEMAQKLEQVEVIRCRLIGDVSHELRTPLTTIKGSMEGLMDGVLPATGETYQQIHAEADRLNHLVDDLQELSRVEAHAYPLDCRAVDVASLVSSAVRRIAVQAQSKNIALVMDAGTDLAPVQVDPDRILQVLTNLIGNAIQYSPEGTHVGVTARQATHEVQIAVKDDGIGIPAEHLPRIFDRFYRVDPSRSGRGARRTPVGRVCRRRSRKHIPFHTAERELALGATAAIQLDLGLTRSMPSEGHQRLDINRWNRLSTARPKGWPAG
jgi:signal transduction histidine kinase